jgi:hypothetical protein
MSSISMAFCFLAMLYNSCSLKQRSLLGKGLFGGENTSHLYWIILNLQLVCHAPYFFRLFREQFTYGESEINTLNFLFTWECIYLGMYLLGNVFTWECIYLGMYLLGNVFTWECIYLGMYLLENAVA